MSQKFVIYEVWTRSRVVEAESHDAALEKNEPEPIEGMSLCNWHAVTVDPPEEMDLDAIVEDSAGALNYRQLGPE